MNVKGKVVIAALGLAVIAGGLYALFGRSEAHDIASSAPQQTKVHAGNDTREHGLSSRHTLDSSHQAGKSDDDLASASTSADAAHLRRVQQVAHEDNVGAGAEMPQPMGGQSEPSEVRDELTVLLRQERASIESELANASQREDQVLVTKGRSFAAGGRFGQAAAAYCLFLDKFGLDHPYSERVMMKLGESLAPLNLASITVLQTPGGPKYEPDYHLGFAPSKQHLRAAVGAYEVLAETSDDPRLRAEALLRVGWIYRALGDWDASTAVWDRCAESPSAERLASDALWLASENLQWVGQPAQGAERMRRLVRKFPDSPRADAARTRAQSLQAEARRGREWTSDPVAALRAEVDARAATANPWQVYFDANTWLRNTDMLSASVAISRWASAQTDWPETAQWAAHTELADALLSAAHPNTGDKGEAIDVLRELLSLTANSSSWLLPTAIKLSGLLREAGRAAEAVTMWQEELGEYDSEPWKSQTRVERLRVFAAVGDTENAEELFAEITRDEPENLEIDELRRLVDQAIEENAR